jgi:hypothetical protein
LSRITFVSGVSGVGKTTAVLALSSRCNVLLEDTAGNPYIAPLLSGDLGNFKAALNQQWFFERMRRNLRQLPIVDLVVCDQAPEVIVWVYSLIFLNDGLMSPSEHEGIVTELHLLQAEIRERWSDRSDILFECDPAIATARLVARDSASPGRDWLSRCQGFLRPTFGEEGLPYELLDTSALGLEETKRALERLILDRP